MLTRWFRHNQKLMLAGVVVMLMVGWGVLGQFSRIARTQTGARGTIRGMSVSEPELYQARQQLEMLQQARELTGADLLGEFIFEPEDARFAAMTQPVTPKAVWRWLILVREAQAAGMQVTQADLANYSSRSVEFQNTVVDLIKVWKLVGYRLGSVRFPRAELWAAYLFENESAGVRLVALRAEELVPLVEAEVGPDQVREFYEQHKDVLSDPGQGTPGYKAPYRVRLEYAVAERANFEAGVRAYDKEIEDYYNMFKDQLYLLPETEKDPVVEDQSGGEDAQPRSGEGAEPGEPQIDTDAGAGSGEAGEVGGESAGSESEPAYVPLSEVSEEIAETIVGLKVGEAAEAAAQRALKDLDAQAATWGEAPLPLQQVARRHGLTYKMAALEDGEHLLTRENVEKVATNGLTLAAEVFDDNALRDGGLVNRVSQLGNATDPLVFQVLEVREPEALPFQQVRDRVREDLLNSKALEKAQSLADELIEDAEESSLEYAVAQLNAELGATLGLRDSEPARQPSEDTDAAVGEVAEPVDPTGTDAVATEREPLLKVRESGMFRRADALSAALAMEAPAVVDEAFRLEVHEYGKVVEGGGEPVCYVIQRTERREADPEGFQQWLTEPQWMGITEGQGFMSQVMFSELGQWLKGLEEAAPMPLGEQQSQEGG